MSQWEIGMALWYSRARGNTKGSGETKGSFRRRGTPFRDLPSGPRGARHCATRVAVGADRPTEQGLALLFDERQDASADFRGRQTQVAILGDYILDMILIRF